MTARRIQIDGPSAAHVLSYSTAKVLLQQSAYHAKLRKDRLLEDDEEDDKKRAFRDRGKVLHSMLLGTSNVYAVAEYTGEPTADDALAATVEAFEETGELPDVEPEPLPAKGRKARAKKVPEPPPNGEFQSWHRGDAKAAKAAIAARGLLPLLPKAKRAFETQAKRLAAEIERLGFSLGGDTEAGVEWSEIADDGSEVVCRGAFDVWNPATVIDLKMTACASLAACIRQTIALDYHVQAAAYVSAAEKLVPRLAGRIRYVILFCEPHTGVVHPIELDGQFRQLGAMRWRRAVNTWARCLNENRWPSYSEGVSFIAPPEYAFAAEMALQIAANDLAAYVPAAQAIADGHRDTDEGEEDDG